MDNRKSGKRNQSKSKSPSSTTSLGKRRSFKQQQDNDSDNDQQQQQQRNKRHKSTGSRGSNQQLSLPPSSPAGQSTMSNPKTSDYGSQASPMRIPTKPNELVKVAILGAAGGIGQPLSLLLMLHSEYIQHLALYDVVNVVGVGADLSHVDRQCKVTTHLGQDSLPEAVRNAKVIVIPAGLAQKPGMSRDDLFGSNSEIMYNLAEVCAQVAPNAMLAIISNPVNSLVPLTCEIYSRILMGSKNSPNRKVAAAEGTSQQEIVPANKNTTKSDGSDNNYTTTAKSATSSSVEQQQQQSKPFEDFYRRIFGVTTLDVVRASTLTAKSAFYKQESSGLFKDPAKISVPVVGGHAGKTIIPLLSQATPKLDKKRLVEEKQTTQALIESIQQAGIEVLNAKRGTGSATLAMAYAACRFTISLLRALQGEQNIIECAYVKHAEPLVQNLDYFACPLILGKNGYTKALGLGKLMPFEERMIEEGAKELRTSVAKGEDFAKEHLSIQQAKKESTNKNKQQ